MPVQMSGCQMQPATNFLRANAYHEAGHAIVAWVLRLAVKEIAIRDDRPGEHVMAAGEDRLPLIDRVALSNAGRQAEEVFGHLLPSWASTCDRVGTLNLLAANDIRATEEVERWIADGCARARELLREHEQKVHRLAAQLVACVTMSTNELNRFMQSIDQERDHDDG
jgi:ATP-dependent Zn protease